MPGEEGGGGGGRGGGVRERWGQNARQLAQALADVHAPLRAFHNVLEADAARQNQVPVWQGP